YAGSTRSAPPAIPSSAGTRPGSRVSRRRPPPRGGWVRAESVEDDAFGQPLDDHALEQAHLAAEGLDFVAGLAGNIAEGAVAAVAVPAVLAVGQLEIHELQDTQERVVLGHLVASAVDGDRDQLLVGFEYGGFHDARCLRCR